MAHQRSQVTVEAAGMGVPLVNDKQVMTADNVTGVLDGWATDLSQSCVAVQKAGVAGIH